LGAKGGAAEADSPRPQPPLHPLPPAPSYSFPVSTTSLNDAVGLTPYPDAPECRSLLRSYTFLVYNASVHHWRVAGPLQREGLRHHLRPSTERVVQVRLGMGGLGREEGRRAAVVAGEGSAERR
jgi:hypothetical protein